MGGMMEESNSTQSFRSWFIAFVVCNFNVDVGPEIELVYPPDTPFSTSDLNAICFNSFPERHDTEITEDMFFHFSIRNNSPSISLCSPRAPYCSPSTFFGTAVFRQEFDSTTKRRYNQKSLVFVSAHDFPAFFTRLLSTITSGGRHLLDPPRLESACSALNSWPPPSPGRFELPFLGDVITLDIPPTPYLPLTGTPTSSLSPYQPPLPWTTLLPLLPTPHAQTLYALYEALLLGSTPILLIGHNPSHVSALTSALVDLIRPIPYTSLVRPYAPMQSPGLGVDLSTAANDSSPFVIGITNPFLVQRIITTPNTPRNSTTSTIPEKPTPLTIHLISDTLGTSSLSAPNLSTSSKHSRTPSLRRRAHTSGGGGSVNSSRNSSTPKAPQPIFLQPPRHLASLVTQTLSPSEPSSTAPPLLRRHFSDLTARLLAPLNRHLASVPTPAGLQAHQPHQSQQQQQQQPHHHHNHQHFLHLPHLHLHSHSHSHSHSHNHSNPPNAPLPSAAPGFDAAAFLAALPAVPDDDSAGDFVGSRAALRRKARERFYERFCGGDNFAAWLAGRGEGGGSLHWGGEEGGEKGG